MDNPVLSHIANHRTHRCYEETPIAADVVAKCVRAAQQAATSSHVQGYALVQVHDTSKRERLAVLTGDQKQVAQAGAFFVVCADQRRHRLIAQREERAYCANLESFLVGVIDASLFSQNLVLAFESLGFGTCYIGGLRTRLPEVDELLALPDDSFPLYGLCVGVPTEEGSPRARLPLDGVLFHDSYPDDDSLLKVIDEHDAIMTQEYEKRGLPGRNWSGGVARKFAKPVREHLLEYYTSKGARIE